MVPDARAGCACNTQGVVDGAGVVADFLLAGRREAGRADARLLALHTRGHPVCVQACFSAAGPLWMLWTLRPLMCKWLSKNVPGGRATHTDTDVCADGVHLPASGMRLARGCAVGTGVGVLAERALQGGGTRRARSSSLDENVALTQVTHVSAEDAFAATMYRAQCAGGGDVSRAGLASAGGVDGGCAHHLALSSQAALFPPLPLRDSCLAENVWTAHAGIGKHLCALQRDGGLTFAVNTGRQGALVVRR